MLVADWLGNKIFKLVEKLPIFGRFESTVFTDLCISCQIILQRAFVQMFAKRFEGATEGH